MKKLLILLPLFCGINACVNMPANLVVDPQSITSLVDIQQQQQHVVNQNVRLGGKILAATALPQQTKLEILSLPISPLSAKPQLDASSNGRFIAYVNGFIDPETLNQQYLTVVGQFIAMEQGKIDQADYVYPVIKVQDYRLWQVVQTYDYDSPWNDYWYPRSLFWQMKQPEWQVRYYLY